MHQRITSRPTVIGALVAAVVVAAVTTGAVSAPAQATPAPAVAGAPAGSEPLVIPALDDWTPSAGTYGFDRRSTIVVSGRGAAAEARTVAADLAAQQQHAPAVRTHGTARTGDIELVVDGQRDDLGDEGYEMTIGDTVRIVGRTSAGAFYGTRTLLQLLSRGDRVPRGHTVDIPRHAERGLELCPCEIKISVPVINAMIADMAYGKLNWLLLPLKMKSSVHPEINQWSYYTQDEARSIVAQARRYHVSVIPEVNAPGHLDPFLFDRPDLQLTNSSGTRSVAQLDVTNPDALPFYTDLIDEYRSVFTDSPDWMLGADEYLIGSAYADYPQIGEYAKREYGPDAQPADAYFGFINQVDDYVRSKGMTLRIWNDGLEKDSVVQVNKDITVQYWIPDELSPQELLDRGHVLMNGSSSLYDDRGSRPSPHTLCPSSATLQAGVPVLWDSGWSPEVFEDGSTVDPDGPQPTGAHISTWETVPAAVTENQEQEGLFVPLRFLAQRTWGRTDAFIDYDEFAARVHDIGRTPGWDDTDPLPLPDGSYQIRPGSGGALSTPGIDDGALAVGRAAGGWQLRATDDGYYRISSAGTGECLDMPLPGGLDLLRSAPHVGATPGFALCSDTANTQKWELRRTGSSGLTITNAISRLVLTVGEGRQGSTYGTVRQLPPDTVTPTRWRFDLKTRATLTVKPDDELLKAGEPNRVQVTYANDEQVTVRQVAIDLATPAGWTLQRLTPEIVRTVLPGAEATAEFTVTPPIDVDPADVQLLSARAEYRRTGTVERLEGAAIVRIDPISCTEPAGPPVDPNDQFTGTELDGCRWTDVQDPDLDTLQVADGRLHLKTGSSDLSGPGGRIDNLMLQGISDSDLTIETRMTAPLDQAYQQAGPIVWNDDDNYTEFVLVAGNAPGTPRSSYLSLVSEQAGEFHRGGVSTLFLPTDTPDGDWYLRLTRTGNTLTGEYSRDGTTWTAMPASVTNDSLTTPRAGLQASGPGQMTPTTVSFDQFHLS